MQTTSFLKIFCLKNSVALKKLKKLESRGIIKRISRGSSNRPIIWCLMGGVNYA